MNQVIKVTFKPLFSDFYRELVLLLLGCFDMARFKMTCFDKQTGEIFKELVWTKDITDENVFDKTMEFNIHFFKPFLFKNPNATLHIVPVSQPQVELPLFNQNCF